MRARHVIVILTLAAVCAGCPKSAPVTREFPVTDALIRGYLDRRGIEFAEKEDGVFGYASGRDTVLIRHFPREEILYLAMPRLLNVPYPPESDSEEDKALAMFAVLMYVNHLELLGKVEWDPGTDEVSFSVAVPTRGGLSYESFVNYCKYVERRGPEIRAFLKDATRTWETPGRRGEPEKPDWSPK